MTPATRHALHEALTLHPDLAEALTNPTYGIDLQHDRDPLEGPDTEGRGEMHRA